MPVIVEAESLKEVAQAVDGAGGHYSPRQHDARHGQEGHQIIDGRALVEVSGGITLDNVRAMAAAKPDRISIGALTHSAPAATLTLELERAVQSRQQRR